MNGPERRTMTRFSGGESKTMIKTVAFRAYEGKSDPQSEEQGKWGKKKIEEDLLQEKGKIKRAGRRRWRPCT